MFSPTLTLTRLFQLPFILLPPTTETLKAASHSLRQITLYKLERPELITKTCHLTTISQVIITTQPRLICRMQSTNPQLQLLWTVLAAPLHSMSLVCLVDAVAGAATKAYLLLGTTHPALATPVATGSCRTRKALAGAWVATCISVWKAAVATRAQSTRK